VNAMFCAAGHEALMETNVANKSYALAGGSHASQFYKESR